MIKPMLCYNAGNYSQKDKERYHWRAGKTTAR